MGRISLVCATIDLPVRRDTNTAVRLSLQDTSLPRDRGWPRLQIPSVVVFRFSDRRNGIRHQPAGFSARYSRCPNAPSDWTRARRHGNRLLNTKSPLRMRGTTYELPHQPLRFSRPPCSRWPTKDVAATSAYFQIRVLLPGLRLTIMVFTNFYIDKGVM